MSDLKVPTYGETIQQLNLDCRAVRLLGGTEPGCRLCQGLMSKPPHVNLDTFVHDQVRRNVISFTSRCTCGLKHGQAGHHSINLTLGQVTCVAALALFEF